MRRIDGAKEGAAYVAQEASTSRHYGLVDRHDDDLADIRPAREAPLRSMTA
jgi:hypothetical protein